MILPGLLERITVRSLRPSWRRNCVAGTPAIDIAETDKDYEITAELPGMEEKNIEVKLANGVRGTRA
jgi:HSP20 family protein